MMGIRNQPRTYTQDGEGLDLQMSRLAGNKDYEPV